MLLLNFLETFGLFQDGWRISWTITGGGQIDYLWCSLMSYHSYSPKCLIFLSYKTSFRSDIDPNVSCWHKQKTNTFINYPGYIKPDLLVCWLFWVGIGIEMEVPTEVDNIVRNRSTLHNKGIIILLPMVGFLFMIKISIRNSSFSNPLIRITVIFLVYRKTKI